MKKQGKNIKTIFIIAITIFLGFTAQINGAITIPAIKAEVDKSQVAIGDIIRYKVTIQLPKDTEIKNPIEKQDKLGEFIVRDFKQKVKQGKQQDIVLEYLLTIFQTGQHSIPEYSIVFRDVPGQDWKQISAKPVEITIQTLLQEDDVYGLKSLKPKVIIWQDITWWVLIAIVIIIGVIATLVIWRRKKITNKSVIKIEAAHVIAYRELEELQKLNLPMRGLIEEYFQKLSDCIRHYLENRFHLRAPWMSTEEFLQSLRNSALLNTPQRKLLKDFLGLSDLVKFARYGASSKEAEDYFYIARNFVDQTREVSKEEETDKL